MSPLAERVRALLDTAADHARGGPQAEAVAALRTRFDEPLRLAIAGKVKAGKSTLLNALVGQELAATDAGECTRVVTWYRDGVTYRATAHPVEGPPRSVPFTVEDGAARVRLDGLRPEALARLEIEWPSAELRQVTLIDTPGIASLSTDLSARTEAFLTADDDAPGSADAVCYLMRHLHGSDVDFLEAFHDDGSATRATPINAIGVLSRADEIGAARLDAMATAERIAARYRRDRQIAQLCQTVVPVAGLLAQAGVTLREDEHRALRVIADSSRLVRDDLLRSADRFVRDDADVTVPAATRAMLLGRLGLYGVRLSVALLRRGVDGAGALASELVSYSGLAEVRMVLATQLVARRDALKARSALAGLQRLLRDDDQPGARRLRAALEEVAAGAHELAEIRALNALRGEAIRLDDEPRERARRLLGGEGLRPATRLDLPADAPAEALRHSAAAEGARWRRRAENPLAGPETAWLAGVVVRSCEGIVAAAADRPSGLDATESPTVAAGA